MEKHHYTGKNTREITFPLGGIGSGSIGLGGNGRLMEWEIKNRPDKGTYNGMSHFAVKAEAGGRVIDAPAAYMPRLDAEAEKETGFRISRHDLVFEGLCPACREKRA